jgi:D-alanyl-D-alanine carboxypeptidase/D-alanyl-D-alanine-endopeptidase (penicillin-binding protein 4)
MSSSRQHRRRGFVLVATVAATTLAGVALAVVLATGAATPAAAGVWSETDTPLPPSIEAIMQRPQYANASWGLLDVDGKSGVPRYSSRADEMFIPGSNAKVFSVSAVWSTLGPDHRFTTPVYAVGRREGGRLRGNLVLFGVGDLSLGGRTTPEGTIDWTNFDHADANAIPGATLTPEDPLAGIKLLARQVRRSGIRSASNVIVDDRLFTASFDPRPTPVMINDNLIDVVVTPTTPGQEAKVTFRPHAAGYSVDPDVRTVAADQPATVQVSGEAPGRITVTGTIPAGAQPLVQVAPIADPAGFARTVFIQALRAEGVQVDAPAVAPDPRRELPPSIDYPAHSRVAAYRSPPYADYAKLIMKVSHNLGANLGVCLLAVRAGQMDCDSGFPAMRAFLRQAGVPLDQMALADGRGGDPVDRASPFAVTQILRYWLGRPDFERFRATLPVLGEDGSLVDVAQESPARGNVFAKTGTLVGGDALNERLVVQTKALGGYYRDAHGDWRTFNVVVNNAGGGDDIEPVLQANEDVGQIAARLWQAANE